MSSPSEPKQPTYNLPPWEPPRSTTSPSLHAQWHDLTALLSRLLDRLFPPQRRFFGVSRRIFLLILSLLFLTLLALILGLSIGLTTAHHSAKPLPLGSAQYTGELTYYEPGLGACGKVSKNGEDVVSVSHFVFDAVGKGGSDPNANGLCGRRMRAVRNEEGGGGRRSVDLRVMDRCVGCQPTDIDVPISVFGKLADPDLGRVDVTWAWLPPIPTIPS